MENKIAFTKQNYYIMIAGVLLIVIGFALMAGGGTDNPTEWKEEIFSFRRITLAPIVVIGGFVVVLLGIMRKTPAVESTASNEVTDLDA